MITKKKKKMKKEIEVKIELTKEEFYKLTKGFKDFDLERTFGYFKEDFSNIKDGIFPRIKYIDGMNREVILTVKVKTNDNSQFFEREVVNTFSGFVLDHIKSKIGGSEIESLAITESSIIVGYYQ